MRETTLQDRLEKIYEQAMHADCFDPAIKVAILLEQIKQQEKAIIAPVGQNVQI